MDLKKRNGKIYYWGSDFMNFNNIEIIKDDITKLEVDAIVNAANNSLLGGGGVDGAIHTAAGPELLTECKKLNGCKDGEAKLSKGYNLKAKYVIHTVAPKWYDNRVKNKEEQLKNCYSNSYKLAIEKNIRSIAFPCIGMGVYMCPLEIGAKISIDEAVKNNDYFSKIYLVCYGDREYNYYLEYFSKLKN